MNRGYFKWIVYLAIACVFIVAIFMWKEKQKEIVHLPQKDISRPIAPFKSYISAVGIVEARGGNIYIGSTLNRVVDKVEVVVGQKVSEGDVLFTLESHDLKADLVSRNIDLENAITNLEKLEALPRKEDLDTAIAEFNRAQVDLKLAKNQFIRVEGLDKNGAMSQEEVGRRQFAYEEAQARFDQAEANLAKVEAGAWPYDLEIAALNIEQAEAAVKRVEADIDRTIVRAPADATVLQIKIHEGEFPPSESSRTPSMIIGDIDTLHMRVSINQFDASFYNPNAPAVAFLQGNSAVSFPLTFVNIEPYFVNKQNLSNDINEKVDTRVLQVIYCFEEHEKRVFVGQQMDVYIETQFTPKE
jgi:multidrug efflux pump subunit AcrA (membrane-fusion protein)